MANWNSLNRVDYDVESGIESLKTNGITCLRGFPNPSDLDTLVRKTQDMLAAPAIYGTQGFYQKDRHKKIYEAFLLGEEALRILLDKRLLDIVEGYLQSDILIQEMIVKHDLGDNELYFPIHTHTGSYRTKTSPGPFSVGIMLYTHDTEEGAFCFSPGTQNWDSVHGSDPSNYPKEMQDQIFQNMIRVAGKRGDIVLFDHRAFHGPQQPVTTPRTVFLGGFHNAEDHGGKTKCPVAVYSTHLRVLSERQKRVLGISSAGSVLEAEEMHYNSFARENPTAYKLAHMIVSASYSAKNLKGLLKRLIRRP